MKRACLFLVLVVVLGGNAWAAAPPTVSALAFYDYDQSQPLAVEQQVLEDKEGYTKYHLTYASAHDQQVTAHLWVPKAEGRHPAVLVQHGYGDSKDVDYVQLPALHLVGKGFVAMAIDAQYHGERARPGRGKELFNTGSLTMRDAFVQTVVDLRRAVDLLSARPEVDTGRIGYWGASMGAFLGSVTAAVEPRLKSVVLVVGGGGLGRLLKGKPTPKQERTLTVVEPTKWVGLISPRPLLMLNGTKDVLIPRAATELLYQAAGEPKRIVWYESGHHDVPMADVLRESVQHLGRM